jgi:serine/threonine-protein kinase
MTNTELDDLKSAWQTLSRNLERQNALALHQFRETKLTRFRAAFRWLVTGQVIQIICGALLSIIGGSFWVDHLGTPHLMIYGLSFHAYGLMMILFAARDLFLLQRLDYTAPVLTLQKQLADLRRWHVQAGLWFGVAGCFIWIPLMLMIFYGLGSDVWTRSPAVVGWFVLSGLVCLGIMGGIIFWSRRPGKERFARALVNSSAGRAVRRSQALLDEIARFEQE